MKALFTLLLFCLSLLTPLAQAQEAKLIAGATVTIRLAGVPAEESAAVSGMYAISSGGSISLPHLKTEINALGLRPTELQAKIVAAYKSAEIYTNPNITVLAAGTNPGSDLVITVGGEVRTPRSVPFRPGLNLYGAISEAGGPSEFADMKRVKLMRGGKVLREIDLRKVTEENNPELQAGDQVIVPGG
jgi:polysaccharide export outer membrane protein